MFSRLRCAALIGATAALVPRLALAHGGNGGLSDLIADWLPFAVVILGLGIYGAKRARGKKRAPGNAPSEPVEEIEV